VFDSELSAMIASDEHHWWYRGRRRILRTQFDRLPPVAARRILDAGCGSGRTMDELAAYGEVSGVDLSAEALQAARTRGHADVREALVERVPYADAVFDVVTCLDVLEHTPDDRVTLRELRRVTRPGGTLIVTVPACPSLWSRHDEVSRHHRRYTSASLRDAAADAGWSVSRDTYFNTLLLGPAALVRLAQRRTRGDDSSDLDRTPSVLNTILEMPLAAEARLLAAGVRLPLGLSLLCVMTNDAIPAVVRDVGFVAVAVA